jgi:hypothetical protein
VLQRYLANNATSNLKNRHAQNYLKRLVERTRNHWSGISETQEVDQSRYLFILQAVISREGCSNLWGGTMIILWRHCPSCCCLPVAVCINNAAVSGNMSHWCRNIMRSCHRLWHHVISWCYYMSRDYINYPWCHLSVTIELFDAVAVP